MGLVFTLARCLLPSKQPCKFTVQTNRALCRQSLCHPQLFAWTGYASVASDWDLSVQEVIEAL